MTNPALIPHLRNALINHGRREFYGQLVVAFRSAISERLLVAGDFLPSERDLSAKLGVSRNVLRRVITNLEADGILSTRHGHGTFVPSDLRKSTNSILGFSEEMIRRGLGVSNEILIFSKRMPASSEAIDLGMSPEGGLIELVRLRLSNGVAIAYEQCLIPDWSVSPDYDGRTSLYAEMDQQGTRPIRVLQEISATAASEDIAKSLLVEAGSPVLRITRKGFNKSNETVEYTASYFRSDRYTWITELHK